MIFKNNFSDLTEKDIELLTSYFDGFDYQSSSHTFIANYIWRDTHRLSWEIIDGYLFIAGLGNTEPDEEEYFVSFPLTKTGSYDGHQVREGVEKVKEIFKSKDKQFGMGLVPETLLPALKDAFGDDVSVEHERDDDDYVYLREDLVTLGGRKLHHKKNHLNYFRATISSHTKKRLLRPFLK